MPGKLFSHIVVLCLGAAVLIGFLVPGVGNARPASGLSGTGDLSNGTVPSWCHHNLQLLSVPTFWTGYRDVNILKRRFTPGAAVEQYRAFVADRNMYVFSSAVDEPLSAFSTEDGYCSLESGNPRKSAVSIYERASSYETLVWCLMPNGLVQAIRANDPAGPTESGEIMVEDTVQDLFVQYRNRRYTLFTVHGTDSVRVYRVPHNNWISLERRGAVDTPGDATAVAHQDSMLYIADGIEGIQVVDVTDVDSLFIAGHYATAGPAKEIAVADTLLFVAEWDEGVEILNIASVDSIFPIAPIIDTPGRAHDVAVQDSLLFVADWDGGLRVYNFARPDSIYLYGFYGIGGQYHSVAVSDSIVVAGDHAQFQILRAGEDRVPPEITTTVTQTPYFRSYLRAYVLTDECLEDPPVARQLILPRQATIEDFEGYADSDTLRGLWTVGDAGDTVSLSTTAFEGSQAAQFHFSLSGNETRLLHHDFGVAEDWRLFDRLAFHFKTDGDTIMGELSVKVFTVDGDSLVGEQMVSLSDWQEYMLDLSALDPRNGVSGVQLGVSSVRPDSTVTGRLLVDHFLLKRIDLGETTKTAGAMFLGDTLDVELEAVSDERHLYYGDFELVDSDTGMTNALLVTATDLSGNVSTLQKEFRAQLVMPDEGGILRSPDSRLSLTVPPAATRMEAFFFILPQESGSLSSLPEGARLASRPYEVGLSGDDLYCDVELTFRLDQVSFDGIDPEELGAYRQDGNGWQFIGGRYDAEERSFRVSGMDLGTVALLANPNPPVRDGSDPVAFRCYPNPFNPNTTISFACPARTHVSLNIYDVVGRLVATLVDDVRAPGPHFVTWNGLSDRPSPVISGIYFARLEVGGEIQTIKLVLIR